MTHEALAAWRTREGTVLLVVYGALAAAVSVALAILPQTAYAYTGTPYWLRFVAPAACLTLVAAMLFSPLRAQAFRLQALNAGAYFAGLVGIFMDRRNGGTWLVMVVICMFAFQYAFMRWQELVATYAGAVVLYAVLAQAQRVPLPLLLHDAAILLAVACISAALGSLRLRMLYRTAQERAELERQTAELRRQTDQKARMAFTDQLTGLLNRSGMNDLIDRALAIGRSNGTRTALLYVDLDGFKQINDVAGHDAGDVVLVEAALRIQYLLRGGESAGRIGGDEFVVLLPLVHSPEEPRALAKRIEEAFREPFGTAKRAFEVSASVGVAWSSENARTRADLLRAADRSMYVVKRWRKAERAAGGGSGI